MGQGGCRGRTRRAEIPQPELPDQIIRREANKRHRDRGEGSIRSMRMNTGGETQSGEDVIKTSEIRISRAEMQERKMELKKRKKELKMTLARDGTALFFI